MKTQRCWSSLIIIVRDLNLAAAKGKVLQKKSLYFGYFLIKITFKDHTCIHGAI